MKKNRMSVMIGFGLVLISLLLAAYRPYVRVAPVARAFANHVPVVVDPADRKFFYAAEISAARALDTVDAADRKFFYAAAASLASVAAERTGIVYAMDPVDLKLFNAAESSPAMATNETGIVYAMDPVDLKLFNASETAGPALAGK